MIHGGAWMSGSKSDGEVQRLMTDFAKRGYVAVAPNYRLGLYQTERNINCNVSSIFDIPWNCLNIQDTTEWYRAYFRAIQDLKGVVSYITKRSEAYSINPNNVFTSGFSAGGFNALGIAFLDDNTEWPTMFTDQLADAKRPNARYDQGCIRRYAWDTSLALISLKRSSLGSLQGELNVPAMSDYKIKGVGNFYGGMFFNLLKKGNNSAAIYGFH